MLQLLCDVHLAISILRCVNCGRVVVVEAEVPPSDDEGKTKLQWSVQPPPAVLELISHPRARVTLPVLYCALNS
jgi:hypothetical protein